MLCMMVHACEPSSGEVDIRGQLGSLPSKISLIGGDLREDCLTGDRRSSWR